MFQKLKILKRLGVLAIWICIFMLVGTLYNNKRNTIYQQSNENLSKANLKHVKLPNKGVKNSMYTSRKAYEPYMQGLDEKQEPNLLQLQKLLSLELPNVPFDYWLRKKYNRTVENITSCTKYPAPLELDFHNTYWQTLVLGKKRFQLYGAYLDKRSGIPQGPVVRILAMVKHQPDEAFPPNYCQLWYEQRHEAVIVPVAEYQLIWPKAWGYEQDNLLYPIFIKCYLPANDTMRTPKAVSVAPVACANATNSLRVHYDLPPPNELPKKFAVCVKGIDFPRTDISARLVEWLELVRLLGAERIFIYQLATHANVRKVLEHYQKTGFVEMRSTTLASGEPGLPHFQHLALQWSLTNKRLNEMIVYNDCFYRQMYKYKYIVAMDIDEVIMPLGNHTSWHDLLKIVETRTQTSKHLCPLSFASFCFNNIYFPSETGNARHSKEVPAYMHMLQHVYRYGRSSPPFHETKCFHRTGHVLVLHNHMALQWLKGVCKPWLVEAQHAQLQHYKVSQKLYEGESLILDRNIWRYKEDLVKRTQRVLKILGFIS